MIELNHEGMKTAFKWPMTLEDANAARALYGLAPWSEFPPSRLALPKTGRHSRKARRRHVQHDARKRHRRAMAIMRRWRRDNLKHPMIILDASGHRMKANTDYRPSIQGPGRIYRVPTGRIERGETVHVSYTYG